MACSSIGTCEACGLCDRTPESPSFRPCRTRPHAAAGADTSRSHRPPWLRSPGRLRPVAFQPMRPEGVLGPDTRHPHVRDASQLCRQLARDQCGVDAGVQRRAAPDTFDGMPPSSFRVRVTAGSWKLKRYLVSYLIGSGHTHLERFEVKRAEMLSVGRTKSVTHRTGDIVN